MIPFKTMPGRPNQMYLGQSTWIGDVYNHFFANKKDGFVVEIGVGTVLDWQTMGTPRKLQNGDLVLQGKSATIELLQYGWSGIYIEPIKEFLYNELQPLLDNILPDGSQRVKMLPYAASDVNGFTKIVCDETLDRNTKQYIQATPEDEIIPYQYTNRVVETRVVSELLSEHNCPRNIDVLLIDVEGFELNVLRGFDFNLHTPKLIFIEIDKTPISRVLELLPDTYTVFAEDGLNAAIVNN